MVRGESMARLDVRKNGHKSVRCSVETTIAAIGGRWKVLIINHLQGGTHRFGQLTRLLGGISARTLTRQLRELEASGIITRHVHQMVPPKVDYALTPLGRQLQPVLDAMHAWGERLEGAKTHLQAKQPSRGHD
jgi:DNA-binding HxlR family transcriptional regulator